MNGDAPLAVNGESIVDEFGWLAGHGSGWQFGEAGILAAIFDALGVERGLAVEFGGGRRLTCEQLVAKGWRARIFEVEEAVADALREMVGSELVEVDHRAVTPSGPSSINALCGDGPIDLLVIDVDGPDAEFLENLRCRPTVICVEHHDVHDRSVNQAEPVRAAEPHGQANAAEIERIASQMGYVRVFCTQINSILVAQEVAGKLSKPRPCAGPFKIVDKPPIAIALSQPRLAFTAHGSCLNASIVRLQREFDIVDAITSGGFPFEAGMSLAIEKALDRVPDGGYILFSDYDGTFEPDDVRELVRIMQACPDLAAVYPVQAHRHNQTIISEDPDGDYTSDATETRAGHFGLTLIRAEALRNLPHPWFWSIPDQATNRWGDGKLDCDLFFWMTLRVHGGRVARANTVQIGHIEQGIKWALPNGRFHWQTVAEYSKRGKPPAVTRMWREMRKRGDEVVQIHEQEAAAV